MLKPGLGVRVSKAVFSLLGWLWPDDAKAPVGRDPGRSLAPILCWKVNSLGLFCLPMSTHKQSVLAALLECPRGGQSLLG